MKQRVLKIILFVALAIALAAVIVIGVAYYGFISKQVSADSEKHLKEVYGQVNNSFRSFIERNWGLLDICGDYFGLVDETEGEEGDSHDATIDEFIETKKSYWKFSEFFFLKEDMRYLTSDGEEGVLGIDKTWSAAEGGDGRIMAGEQNAEKDRTVFVARIGRQGSYKGFAFGAIAIGYDNSEIAPILNADAFSGEAKCFVVHGNGEILLSTSEGGAVYSNYLEYLDMLGVETAQIRKDFSDFSVFSGENRLGKYFECEYGPKKVPHCIVYQPVGYLDYLLLSDVPQSAVSEGFLLAQRTTMWVLLIIFSLMIVVIAAVLIVRSYLAARRNRTELAYREKMFDVLSNTVDDIFIMLDPSTQAVNYLSPNVERLLGIPNSEVKRDIRAMAKCAVDYNIIVPKGELAEIPINKNKHWECEYMHQSTGEKRWYRVTIYHLEIQGTEKYIVVMSDRTLEQQMNQKLQEALDTAKSANEAKSNFLSNMSHDIRTPMNAIVGFSVLLEKDADQAEKVREYTRKITAASHHLLSLINDVLDMSKIESGKTSLNIESFSLPELLEELNIIIMPQAKAKEQNFAIRVQGTPPEQILGDKLRLNQILLNLLSNAIKYTQQGGNIEFTVTELDSAAPQYAKLRFRVKDNGIGMSEEFQKQVFAPFSREINSVTNKIQGTGLGMAITKNIVDLMGGIITVESELNKGSVFTVELSFALPDPQETDQWFKQKITRMLVADDEEEICFNIREMMRDTGVEVSCVTDGASAVELSVEAHRCGHDFHVILLDWKMPGMDGVETARKIREAVGKDVPILVLTSYDWAEIETEARLAGINAFMPKPFFVSTFWQTIKPLFFEPTHEANEKEKKEYAGVMEGKRFLVAEDNELNAEILTEMLDMEGATCEIAVNGSRAVQLFEASEENEYDMILMDVQMPIMNGYEATRKIRACGHPRAKSIPIVAMTANTFAEDVKSALDAGMDAHLAKPIDMRAVRETVGKLLSARRS